MIHGANALAWVGTATVAAAKAPAAAIVVRARFIRNLLQLGCGRETASARGCSCARVASIGQCKGHYLAPGTCAQAWQIRDEFSLSGCSRFMDYLREAVER